MNTRFKSLVVTALLSISYISDAALIFGTTAGTSVADDCPSFCTDFIFGPSLGGEGVTITGTSSVAAPFGNASASAELTGGLNTPVLKAKSEANPTLNGAFATAFGVQGYTYNGPSGTISLDISLDGNVTDFDSDPTDTSVFFEVVLYEIESFAFFTDRGSLDFELGATPLVQNDIDLSEASVQLQLDFLNPTSVFGEISIDVETGDEFYIWAFLRAESQSGLNRASADAFNTGFIEFLDNPDLVAASTSVVPVPASVWLFASGLVGLVTFARRKHI